MIDDRLFVRVGHQNDRFENRPHVARKTRQPGTVARHKCRHDKKNPKEFARFFDRVLRNDVFDNTILYTFKSRAIVEAHSYRPENKLIMHVYKQYCIYK